MYLELSGYKYNLLDEWFIDCPEVLTLFHESQEKISRILWRYRDSVWSKEDLDNNADKRLREIYEDSREKFLKPGTYREIDKVYSMLVSQETLKKMRSDNDNYMFII